MDITRTVEPKSDQLNFDDVASHALTITITEVKAGPADQPVELHNNEYPGRPYKPGKSMRRVLIAAWGTEAAAYVGRRITLYGDPTIRFGKDAVGGIRIRALSHISEPLTIALTVTRGQRKPFTVQPLPETGGPSKVDAAVTAIGNAADIAALDKIADYARNLGIDGIKAVAEALATKRAELPELLADDWTVADVKP